MRLTGHARLVGTHAPKRESHFLTAKGEGEGVPNQLMVAQANDVLSAASTVKLVREYPEAFAKLAEPGSLVDVAREVLKVDRSGLDYLSAMPTAIQEAVRAAICDALTERSGKPVKPVQVSYVPNYEFGVQVVDYGEALTIQISGPYSGVSPRDGSTYAKRRTSRSATKRKSVRGKASVRKTGAKQPRRRGR
jgi:hypothetical protein